MWKKFVNRLQKRQHQAVLTTHSFIEDELGLSGIVVAILLILVAVLAVVIIWGFLSGYLEELWDQITANTIS